MDLRMQSVEVLDVPVAAALQSSTAIDPALRRVSADWASEVKAAERAASAEGWAAHDEFGEVTEQLAALRDNYAEEAETGGTSCSGFSSGYDN